MSSESHAFSAPHSSPPDFGVDASPANAAASNATTPASTDDGEIGLISSWIEISNKTISSPNDAIQLSRVLTLGEWDCERTPCFCLTFKMRPSRAPRWFYHSVNLNKKEAEWFKQNSGAILSRRPQRYDIKNKDGAVLRSVTTGIESIKGVDRLVVQQIKNGKEFRPFRISMSKTGDFIRAICDSLDEFHMYLNKQYDEDDE